MIKHLWFRKYLKLKFTRNLYFGQRNEKFYSFYSFIHFSQICMHEFFPAKDIKLQQYIRLKCVTSLKLEVKVIVCCIKSHGELKFTQNITIPKFISVSSKWRPDFVKMETIFKGNTKKMTSWKFQVNIKYTFCLICAVMSRFSIRDSSIWKCKQNHKFLTTWKI